MPSIFSLSSSAITELFTSITEAPTSVFKHVDTDLLSKTGNHLLTIAGQLEEEKASFKAGKLPNPVGFDKRKIDEWLKTPTVAIVSKSYCPYCKNVKDVFNGFVDDKSVKLEESDVYVWEIDYDDDCSQIQDYMKTITGGRSVPRVFIKGRFIGGCDDTLALNKSGKLIGML